MRASSSAPIRKRPIRKRRVFYIPGYDPIHPRRYRELYRKEGADQAKISGYEIDLKPKRAKGAYGWHVEAQIDGQEVESDFAVLAEPEVCSRSWNLGGESGSISDCIAVGERGEDLLQFTTSWSA